MRDELLMNEAIGEALLAVEHERRPFGCVVADVTGKVVVRTFGSELPWDPTFHSEIRAIRRACVLVNGLLDGYVLVSTHEPCLLCAGAIVHSKVSRVVFGSYRSDLPELFRPRKYTLEDLLHDTSVPVEVVGGVERERCVKLFQHELEALGVGLERSV